MDDLRSRRSIVDIPLHRQLLPLPSVSWHTRKRLTRATCKNGWPFRYYNLKILSTLDTRLTTQRALVNACGRLDSARPIRPFFTCRDILDLPEPLHATCHVNARRNPLHRNSSDTEAEATETREGKTGSSAESFLLLRGDCQLFSAADPSVY